MALQVEIWHETIQEKLLEDNSFLNHISDVSSEHIVSGSIVHISQAGDPSKVVKNRSVFPAETFRNHQQERGIYCQRECKW